MNNLTCISRYLLLVLPEKKKKKTREEKKKKKKNSPVSDKGHGAHDTSFGTTGSVGRDESPCREERDNKAGSGKRSER